MTSGNGTLKKKMATKAAAATSPIEPAFDGAVGDAHQRLQHDGEHRRLHADEQRRDRRRLPVGAVEHRQRQHEQRARQHEQQPGGEPALDAVQPPAGIGRELHRLGSRQQHAEAERGEKAALVEPAPLIDQHAVHQGDLRGRTAERQQADLAEDARRSDGRRVTACAGCARVVEGFP